MGKGNNPIAGETGWDLCKCGHHRREHYDKVDDLPNGKAHHNTGCAQRSKLSKADSECPCVRYKKDYEEFQKRLI